MVGPIMSESSARSETVELLQELGLKEYEARCFLALTQLSEGTAKEISDISSVPRTRVYDATRVLEAKGLVEVQHSNPQQFRAVSIAEATDTLRQQYADRIETLHARLERLGPPPETNDEERLQEVWSLTSHEAISNRTRRLIEDASSEVVLIVVDDSILTDALLDGLREAVARDVSLLLGGLTNDISQRLRDAVPEANVFETELTWLTGSDDDDIGIGRLMLVDQSTLLVSSFYPDEHTATETERAVFATGLGNGVIVLIRRMLASGLLPAADPMG